VYNGPARRAAALRIAVLGASGFLGLNTVSDLMLRGFEIIALCPKDESSRILEEHGVEVIDWDMLNPKSFDVSLRGVDWLVHLASTTNPKESMLDPDRDAANLAASGLMFQRGIDSGVKKMVFSSSGGTIYGDPGTNPVNETFRINPTIPYARTKLAIENELFRLTEGTAATPVVLRLGNPYGKHQHPNKGTGVITAWLEAVRDGKPVVVFGDGESARDFFHVSDAVAAIRMALASENARGIYNIGSGTATSLNSILAIIEDVTERTPDVTRVSQRPSDVVKAIALDSSKAHRDFGWKAVVGLREGIQQTWNWVQLGEPLTLA
jgi:UDP-glucose 4-epimerase